MLRYLADFGVFRSSSNPLLALVLDGLQLPFRFEPPKVGLLAYLGAHFWYVVPGGKAF